jgi:two-component system sensor histidine kinase KdpD
MCNYLIKMNSFISLNTIPKLYQYAISVLIIIILSTFIFIFFNYIAYAIPFILLFAGLYIYIFLNILSAIIAIVLAGITWDLAFFRPHFFFELYRVENIITVLVLFLIGVINVFLINKIRKSPDNQIAESAGQTIKFYDTLLNSLSHELRTPIAVIVGASDSLLQPDLIISDNNKMELLQEISIASLRLNQQIENLLNTSRIQSGFLQLKKDWNDVSELIHDVLAQLDDQLKDHIVNVNSKEDLPLFNIDRGLMEQVLYNLIYNAAIYTPDHSVISITANQIKDGLQFIVEDNGKGFSAEEGKKAFNKFCRKSNSTAGGLGLGLSIVKGFVEVHNGKVELKKSASGGAKFIIQILAESMSLKTTAK